jgi:hypothetical protein
LKHVAQYSPLLSEQVKADITRAGATQPVKERFQRDRLPLSELPQFLNKTFKLDVPVFTVWGACEDVSVLEKLRSQEYKIENLHVIDESQSRLLDVGGVKLRLLGLGGAVVMHKLFDNGEGRTTIAGGQGTMWTTLLQIGELIDTANRVYDPTETRVLVTHASPAREGLLNQLSVTLKADFSISAGLHFRYGSSYNEFSVNPSLDHYRGKLSASKASFHDVWETVKQEVEPAVSENDTQSKLLQLALDLVSKMPSVANGGNPFGGAQQQNGSVDESAFKNMWNFNLADAAFGWLVLDVDQGRIGTEMRAQGFNFSHRGGKAPRTQGAPAAPINSTMAPTGGNLPTPVPNAAQQRPPPPSQGSTPAPTGAQSAAPQATQQRANQTNSQQASQSKGPQQAATPQKTGSTPQPAGASGKDANGAAAADANKPDAPNQNRSNGAQQSLPPQEPSKSIFVSFIPSSAAANTVDDVKSQLFTTEDAEKVQSVEKTGNGKWVAHFATPEIVLDVLKRNPSKEVKDKFAGVKMAVFRRGGFADRGGFNNRGGQSQRGGGEGRGGYQSTGGTGSDSEGGRGGRGRGRGGFRGERGAGRGRGGRGGDRGGAGSSGPAAGDS